MCKNQILITNKYNGRSYYVNCGHCPSCLQQKADVRANMLRLCQPPATPYFVTLTYSNDYVPYIKFSELPYFREFNYDDFNICIYRRCSYNFHKHLSYEGEIIESQKYIEYDSLDNMLDSTKQFNFVFDNSIGVLFYEDIKKFLKRLRGFTTVLSYFVCGEYGGQTFRPHWHLLLYCTTDFDLQSVWPFGFSYKEVAVDVSSYLSSYVNFNLSNLHPFLLKFFPQKHHRSKDLLKYHIFSLIDIYSLFQKNRSVKYNYKFLNKDKYEFREIYLPTYLMVYYFPNYNLFKYVDNIIQFYEMIISFAVLEVDYNEIYICKQNHNQRLFDHPLRTSFKCMYDRMSLFADSLGISVFDYLVFSFEYVKARSSQLYIDNYNNHGLLALVCVDFDTFNFFKSDLYQFCDYFNCDINLLKNFWLNVKNLDYQDICPYFATDDYYRDRFYKYNKFHHIHSLILNYQENGFIKSCPSASASYSEIAEKT